MTFYCEDFPLMGKQALIYQSYRSIALLEKIDRSHPSSLKPELILGNQS
jgi:hypothetical protein